ncbi:alpha/beta fold hydrolase [Kalamiella sp. sgz302252]|uniref:alpha/beta fold hydrolase n=1 Tax=Pantoea sp. sgz302252 TaxID=3341827 RepID=UPI0036D2B1D5
MARHALSYSVQGSGFPILLGHSYFFDKTMWAPQITELSRHFTTIAVDLWGHGDSPELPAGSATLADLAHDHLKLMDKLGFQDFALAGLSVGGMWGAELAAQAGERLRALVLMDTFIGAEPEAQKQQYFSMLETADRLGAIPEPVINYAAAQFYSAKVDALRLEALKTQMRSLSAERLRQSIVPLGKMIFGRRDRLALLSDIRCPVLVMTGEHDKPRPVSEGQLMAALLQCRHITVPDAGHISCLENPAFVNHELLTFLSDVL